jgi:hypothetical protein
MLAARHCRAASVAGYNRQPFLGTAIAEPPRWRLAVNWFNLSLVGWFIVIVALAIAAYMMHAPPVWIGIGALAGIGIGVIASVAKSKPQV